MSNSILILIIQFNLSHLYILSYILNTLCVYTYIYFIHLFQMLAKVSNRYWL